MMAVGSHLFPYRTQQLSPHTPKVLGWKRPGRIGSRRFYSSVAQLVEQSAVNRSVVGSSPTRGAIFKESAQAIAQTLYYFSMTFTCWKRACKYEKTFTKQGWQSISQNDIINKSPNGGSNWKRKTETSSWHGSSDCAKLVFRPRKRWCSLKTEQCGKEWKARCAETSSLRWWWLNKQ